MRALRTLGLPIMTRTLPVRPDADYRTVATIDSFGAGFALAGGVNLPKVHRAAAAAACSFAL